MKLTELFGFRRPPDYSVLLVCRANLCRSPMAQLMLAEVLRRKGMQNACRVASAGTEVTVAGRLMDPRASRVLAAKGIPLSRVKSRGICAEDFRRHRMILGLDRRVTARLRDRAPDDLEGRVADLSQFGCTAPEIPDPYYGTEAGFVRVYDLLLPVMESLADQLRREIQV
ncbi:low molecular weight protein-tyrosine-phosphatase [Parahaliea aestuarii]|uniref:protein-tyrosine-phosphatase n=1 Tax=Parahaliea aestuarii TaxID=1852021 RepID=A0A5C8ZM82_9GAMM|nr:low molecular weight protein-tyrosine-phosphatase [Parahaliea aestuarii]TXS89666.1 low molecular weight phosphotyrosine protein phosphatase [Parahaliea aestuarii]